MLSRVIKAIIIVITIQSKAKVLEAKNKTMENKGMKEIPNENEICMRLTLLKGSRVI